MVCTIITQTLLLYQICVQYKILILLTVGYADVNQM